MREKGDVRGMYIYIYNWFIDIDIAVVMLGVTVFCLSMSRDSRVKTHQFHPFSIDTLYE